MGRILATDLALTALALGVAGALFRNTGTRFSMVLFSTNWAVFSFLTMLAMEWPLFTRFCRRHGLDPSDFGLPGDR